MKVIFLQHFLSFGGLIKQHNIYKDMGTSSARVSNVFNAVNNPSYEFLQSFVGANFSQTKLLNTYWHDK